MRPVGVQRDKPGFAQRLGHSGLKLTLGSQGCCTCRDLRATPWSHGHPCPAGAASVDLGISPPRSSLPFLQSYLSPELCGPDMLPLGDGFLKTPFFLNTRPPPWRSGPGQSRRKPFLPSHSAPFQAVGRAGLHSLVPRLQMVRDPCPTWPVRTGASSPVERPLSVRSCPSPLPSHFSFSLVFSHSGKTTESRQRS